MIGTARRSLIFLFVFAFSGCSDTGNPDSPDSGVGGNPVGTGKSTSMVVTQAEGGTLELEGMTLRIPADAVQGDTKITVTSSTSPAPANFKALGPVYVFEPAGLSFDPDNPPEVTFPVPAGKGPAVVRWTNRDSDEFGSVIGGAEADETLTATVFHFSSGFAAASDDERGDPPGPIFTGDFESGDTTAWDSTTAGPSGSNTLSVTSRCARGSYTNFVGKGLEITTVQTTGPYSTETKNATPKAYVSKTLKKAPDLRLDFWIDTDVDRDGEDDLDTLSVRRTGIGLIEFLHVYASNNATLPSVIGYIKYMNSTPNRVAILRFAVRHNKDIEGAYGPDKKLELIFQAQLPDNRRRPTRLTVEWVRATKGKKDGALRAFRNGNLMFGAREDLDNSDYDVSEVQLGVLSPNWGGSGPFCIDEVKLSRMSCTDLVCDEPPASSCDGTKVKAYANPGTCEKGVCSYAEATEDCGKETKKCEGGAVVTSTPTCAKGKCETQETKADCASGLVCESGACVNDSCAGITCDSPPPPSCDGDDAVSYSSTGKCSDGNCSYPDTRQDCAAFGQYCAAGQCVTVVAADATVDAGMPDATVDAGIPDTSMDSGISDTSVDSGISDTSVDSGISDTSVDSGISDTSVDSGILDTSVDSGILDTSVDSGISDTSVDSGISDTSVDSGISDASNDQSIDSALPANGETCATAWPISSLPFTGQGNNSSAIDDYIAVAQCPGFTSVDVGGKDQVFSYTPTTTGNHNINISAQAIPFPAILYITTNCAAISSSCVGFFDFALAPPQTPYTVALTANTTYYFIVDAFVTQEVGSYTINVTGP